MTKKKSVGWKNKRPDDPRRHGMSARGIKNAGMAYMTYHALEKARGSKTAADVDEARGIVAGVVSEGVGPEDWPKYPKVHVRMVGEDGNAFAILGRVRTAMRDAGVSNKGIEAFTTEATSGDYDNLLATVMRWVEVD